MFSLTTQTNPEKSIDPKKFVFDDMDIIEIRAKTNEE